MWIQDEGHAWLATGQPCESTQYPLLGETEGHRPPLTRVRGVRYRKRSKQSPADYARHGQSPGGRSPQSGRDPPDEPFHDDSYSSRSVRPAGLKTSPGDANQYASALMTSPPLIVPSPAQVMGLTELLMNRTDPSQNATFAPPGCREDAAITFVIADQGRPRLPPVEGSDKNTTSGWEWWCGCRGIGRRATSRLSTCKNC